MIGRKRPMIQLIMHQLVLLLSGLWKKMEHHHLWILILIHLSIFLQKMKVVRHR
ncbi:hypothetical protein LINGRAHAP2_LOCUS34784 [Linum grandiflorum]